MRPYLAPSLVVLAILAAMPGLAAAQIYKCTGPGGSVQYSQSRSSANCTEVNETPTTSTGGDNGSVNRYLKQVDEEREAKDKQQVKAAKDDQLRQQACSNARSRAAMLSQTDRVFTTDENGNRSYLSDQQYDQQRQQANAAVDQLCN
jgi:hypothetical protein